MSEDVRISQLQPKTLNEAIRDGAVFPVAVNAASNHKVKVADIDSLVSWRIGEALGGAAEKDDLDALRGEVADIRIRLGGKMDTLIAGENIAISEDNVISAASVDTSKFLPNTTSSANSTGVTDSASVRVREGANLNMEGIANLNMRDSAKANIRDSANLNMRQGANLNMEGGANLNMADSANLMMMHGSSVEFRQVLDGDYANLGSIPSVVAYLILLNGDGKQAFVLAFTTCTSASSSGILRATLARAGSSGAFNVVLNWRAIQVA